MRYDMKRPDAYTHRSTWNDGWTAACEHIETKIRCKLSNCDIGNAWIEVCANIAKEAKE